MRADNTLFATDNIDSSKQPRYVVSIDFDGTLQHITSHDDIANVPAALSIIQNAILGISATTQTLNPDRANATIGSMSFEIVDLGNAFTNVVRTQLATNDIGLRGRTVQFFVGYKSEQDGAGILDGSSTDDNPDFDNFVLFQTQIVQSVETKEGRYSIKCADIQRQTKKQIFELALTYLTASIDDTVTTIPVLDLSGFEGNVHGTSYTDAPSLDVIYIQLDTTKEIIRCPTADIVGNSFTNVTRGALQTTAKAVEVDTASASDRRPKVEEYVYLELPAVKLAYAVLTGVIDGTANVLPSNWHAAVPTSFVRLTDFKAIGEDLWVPTDDTKGLVLRFDGIDKQDAKKFLETEIYLLLGLFSPVYSDGQLGLKRMVPSLSDSPFQFDIDDSNVIGSGTLVHDMESMQNNLRIDWNWNGDRYIRSTIIIDSGSIARHGQAPEKRMSFRGLVGTRFTEQVLRQLLTSLRDMYAAPPLRLDINGFHLLNPLEVGDACRINLSNIRDYSQSGGNLVRTMVIHGMTVDWLKGVKLKLFGSSERADEIPPIEANTCLPDAFYPQEGTALNSIPGLMTGNVTNAGSFTLTGSADMNAAASIFYHDAPLTISSTTTLNIVGNVQLRVRGFLTIDGTIDGTEQGIGPGSSLFVFDEHYYFFSSNNVGNPGFIGNSNGHHGLLFRQPDDSALPSWVWVAASYFTQGLFDAFPNIILEVDDAGSGTITGIPTDMRGGGGAHGQKAGLKVGLLGRTHQKADGGAGGTGGGALCVVCRGGDFGIGGEIRLDGGDSVEPLAFFTASNPTFHIYGGAGGAGAPGALLWLIDGSGQTFPDIAGHFFAFTGAVTAQFALPFLGGSQNRSLVQVNAPLKNMAPFMPNRISGFDQSGVNFRISFLPCDVVPEDDQDTIILAPTNIGAISIVGGVRVTWTNTGQERIDVLTEIHRANEDVRASAVRIATVAGEIYDDMLGDLTRKHFYWVRHVDADGNVSVFEPDTSTTPASAFAIIPQGSLSQDPLIRLGASHWEFFANSGNPPTYNVGSGTKGTDTLQFANLTGVLTYAQTAARRGPDEFDVEATQGMVIEIRYRVRQSVDETSGIFTTDSRINIVTEEEGGANTQTYQAEGSIVQFDETSPVGQWFENTSVATLDNEDVSPFLTKPRYIQIRVLGLQNSNGAEFQVDLLDASVVGSIFTGAKQTGMVLAPASESGLFLKDDGTFGTPTGSGVDSFNTRIGAVVSILADYDSFFLTPGEGDAAYSLLGHSHVPADITFAATNRFLARDTAGGGPGEEITAAAARTILNVENASTADQTAAEIEAIVDHDNLQGVSAAQHVDWAITGAEDIHANRLSAGANMADSSLDRPHISDFAIKHQVIAAIATTIINYTAGQSILLNMGAVNIGTLTINNWPLTGRLGQLQIEIKQGATPRTINWPAAVDWVSGVAPDLSISNETYIVNLTTRDGGAGIIGSFPSDSASVVVVTFNGRSGAVVPLQADYDGFFLTPAEGDAAYSLLGHSHVLADITDSGALAALNTVGTSQINNDAVTYAKIQNVVADDRILGNIAGAGGIVAELTATQVRAMINVESGSTADQTAGEIEAIVNHDNLQGVSAAEHVNWAASGAENIETNRFAAANFSGQVNLQDNILRRPLVDDFAVRHQVVTGVASTTINYASGQSVLLNLSAANITTLTINNWPATGRLGQMEFEITQGATPRTIAWDTLIAGTIDWPGGTEPDLNVAKGRFLVHLRSRDGKTSLIGTFAEDFS